MEIVKSVLLIATSVMLLITTILWRSISKLYDKKNSEYWEQKMELDKLKIDYAFTKGNLEEIKNNRTKIKKDSILKVLKRLEGDLAIGDFSEEKINAYIKILQQF